jgi:hypothetical protein
MHERQRARCNTVLTLNIVSSVSYVVQGAAQAYSQDSVCGGGTLLGPEGAKWLSHILTRRVLISSSSLTFLPSIPFPTLSFPFKRVRGYNPRAEVLN